MTPFLGQIMMFAGNYAPSGYAFCNGQLLNISQNSALFALLGTAYGGNGIQTFGLPNLQSRLPIHVGTGFGLSSYVLGQVGGVTDVTITTQTMPTHTHMLNATQTKTTTTGSSNTIGTTVLPGQPTVGSPPRFYGNPQQGEPPLVPYNMPAAAVSSAGNSLSHTNMMPSLCISFVIALVGIYPSRS
jgi:microcystin-dependent protein